MGTKVYHFCMCIGWGIAACVFATLINDTTSFGGISVLGFIASICLSVAHGMSFFKKRD